MTNKRNIESLPLGGDEQIFDGGTGTHADDGAEAREGFLKAQRVFELELSFEAFAERFNRCTPAPEHTSDLFLATACSAGVGGAAELLVRRHGRAIGTALARLQLSPTLRDEAYSKTLEIVFVGEGSGPAINGYQGRGGLAGWLKVAAVRAAHRVLRQRDTDPAGLAQREPTSVDLVDAEAVWSEQERALLDAEGAQVFRTAFRDAIDRLDPEDQRTLRLHYVDRLSIDALAELWSVHRATAARRVAKLRQGIRTEVLQRLQTDFGTSPSSVGRWVRRMQSQLSGINSALK